MLKLPGEMLVGHRRVKERTQKLSPALRSTSPDSSSVNSSSCFLILCPVSTMFLFCRPSLILVFSLHPTAIASDHRGHCTPRAKTHIFFTPPACTSDQCSLAFTIRYFSNHEFLIPNLSFLVLCAGVTKRKFLY